MQMMTLMTLTGQQLMNLKHSMWQQPLQDQYQVQQLLVWRLQV
jgi:hypothetical protein